jgi:two-component system chemotaxis sensor kinase CheA
MVNDAQADFILESREHLQVFERSLLALECAHSAQQVRDCIDASLRAMHSLKGNAGFLGFQTLQKLAHATESVLENYRNQTDAPPAAVVEAILLANDRLAAMLGDLDHSHTQEISSLLKTLNAVDLAANTSRTPPNVRREKTTLHLSLRLPPPPATMRTFFESLLALGSLSDVQLTAQDLHTNVDQWPLADTRLSCNLQTDLSILELRQRLASIGQAVPWSDWGAVELVDFDIASLALRLSAEPGELVYEPTNLLEGLPTQPILWVTNRRNAEALAGLAHREIQATELEDANSVLTALCAKVNPDLSELASARSETPPKQTSMESSSPSQPGHKERRRAPSPSLAGKAAASPAAPEKTNSLRVQVDLLDRLMNLVSELTLVRNQSVLAFGETDGAPQAVLQRLHSVTSELQEAVLKTRMQPVGSLFGRFPRMVRDLARQLGKQVELVLVGQEVELDKTVLEQLSDPLTHLIRNSIDHGLETPEERLKRGKSIDGQVTLSATAADGQVIIEIRDDGRGIDPDAVRAKVLARGIKTEAELQKISARELYSYILLPGFSTAKQVSDVSGRGVGMDVVKTNVERLEGSLTIDSSLGLGTTMTLRVPLTLAIIPCLIVTAGGQRFAVPQRGLEEIVCLHPGGRGSVEHSYDAELFRLRNVLLPIVRLKEVLQHSTPFTAKTKTEIMANHPPAARDPSLIEYILVLRTGGRKFGLLIDDVRGNEEVVVKPMHPSLKKIGVFAGATLMGDGHVALIANIDGIAEHARCYGVEPPKSAEASNRDPAEVHRVLLFEYGPEEQFALPLVQVRRIESIDMEQVELVGDQAFITINGVATRIVQLDKYLNVSKCEMLPSMHLVLPKFVSEPMGILVSRIVDTESLSIALQDTSLEDPGLLGTAIIRGRLSLFLDTQYLRERLFGSSPSGREAVPLQTSRRTSKQDSTERVQVKASAGHVLLVDDTPFFREVVKRYLEREGLTVTTAVDGKAGLQRLAEEEFDLVVSDIEMPNMDGWEFCSQARKRGYSTPFLALTSLSKLENSTKARDCGFDGFEEKLDHDRLIGSVLSMLKIDRREVLDGR